jgi:hypothetical protein
MVVGVDVSHPGVGNKVDPSIAALAVSFTPDLMTYRAFVRVRVLID